MWVRPPPSAPISQTVTASACVAHQRFQPQTALELGLFSKFPHSRGMRHRAVRSDQRFASLRRCARLPRDPHPTSRNSRPHSFAANRSSKVATATACVARSRFTRCVVRTREHRELRDRGEGAPPNEGTHSRFAHGGGRGRAQESGFCVSRAPLNPLTCSSERCHGPTRRAISIVGWGREAQALTDQILSACPIPSATKQSASTR